MKTQSRPVRGMQNFFRKKRRSLEKRLFPRWHKNRQLEQLNNYYKEHLTELPGAPRLLDTKVPIREGKGQVDIIASLASSRELIFIWFRRQWTGQDVIERLPDYHWIQSNFQLWRHYYPQAVGRGQFCVQAWGIGLEITPDVQTLLGYMEGVRMKIMLAHLQEEASENAIWKVQPALRTPYYTDVALEEGEIIAPFPPTPKPFTSLDSQEVNKPYLTEEEVRDMLALHPAPQNIFEDEITEPAPEGFSDFAAENDPALNS